MSSDIGSIMAYYLSHMIGQPYRWGGQGPLGWDCSGLVGEALRSVGLLRGDITAQGLADRYAEASHDLSDCAVGDLVCYGASLHAVGHVAMVWQIVGRQVLVIEAGGGGRDCQVPNGTPMAQEADLIACLSDRSEAMVRVRPIDYRSDRVLICSPWE